ncbi:Cryptochrome-2 [Heracleum sosnowskyi]|uniref:Cryptochrome-2 n=1 Tax=Heracleum sosnowskyi TaxID=360622 RepID=A0AAD8I7B0_9APIA|nr:Cryptochrome-2 [Heracleum sosnowskyi]
MDGKCKTIVWFRRDLRIDDNPALVAGARDGSVLPVFIWCPQEEGQFYPGRVSRWWLKQSLVHLQQSMESLGAKLVLIKAQSTLKALLECISAVGATKIVYNHLYDPVSLVRDHTIKQKLGELGISVESYNGDLLYEPWEIYDNEGHAFTTFDAYWARCLNMQKEPVSHLPPWRLVPVEGMVGDCSIEDLGLENEMEKSSNALLGRGWSPGWSNADKALNTFVEHNLIDYSKDRITVSGNSTSLFSPHLHFGEMSVRRVFHCVRMKQILWTKEANSVGQESVALFLRAIGFREYSRYICFNYPFTHERSLLSNLKFFPWQADQAHFKAWRQGRTGYPLVDADLESDILGWQYISGSLPDGHELERLDSPQVQGFKFDPEGEYVRQWLPELARMPSDWIHHPWDAPSSVLRSAGVELGLNYPVPIVDIDLARDRLSDALLILRERECVARAEKSGGNDEVVGDNSDCIDNLAIPKVVLKETAPCSATSSHDQQVPSMQSFKNGLSSRKRLLPVEEEGHLKKNMQISNSEEAMQCRNRYGEQFKPVRIRGSMMV